MLHQLAPRKLSDLSAPSSSWSETRTNLVNATKGLGPFLADKILVGLLLGRFIKALEEDDADSLLGPGACTGILVRRNPPTSPSHPSPPCPTVPSRPCRRREGASLRISRFAHCQP